MTVLPLFETVKRSVVFDRCDCIGDGFGCKAGCDVGRGTEGVVVTAGVWVIVSPEKAAECAWVCGGESVLSGRGVIAAAGGTITGATS